MNKVNFYSLFSFSGVPFILNRGHFVVKENVKINSIYSNNPIGGNTFSSFWVKEGGKLTIDRGARISNSAVVCAKEIYIGKDVYIGGDCRIYDTDFHSINFKDRIHKPDKSVRSEAIIISDRVFIGASTIILKGVRIGENSLIGAGSIVTKSIPENQIWAGNPAKFIRELNG